MSKGLERTQAGSTARPAKAVAEKSSVGESFTEKLGGVDRNERANEPGRASRGKSADREGVRSKERDPVAHKSVKDKQSAAPRRVENRDEAVPMSSPPREPIARPRNDLQPEPIESDASASETPSGSERVASSGASAGGPMSASSGISDKEASVTAARTKSSPGEKPLPGADPTGSRPESSPEAALVATGAVAGSDQLAKSSDPAPEDLFIAMTAMQAAQGQVRKHALENFMSNMQKEFGVAPEKIVEAFGKMSEHTLTLPPEESTKAFIANLGLKPGQETKAAAMYDEMVRTTGDAALSEKLIGMETGVNFDVVSPQDESLRKLNRSIDDLNDMFAMRGNPNPEAAGAQQGQIPAQAGGQMADQLRNQMAADQMNAQLAEMRRQNEASERKGGDESALLAVGTGGVVAAESAGADAAATGAASGAASGSTSGAGASGAGGLLSAMALPGLGALAGGAGAGAGGAGGGGLGGEAAGGSLAAEASASSAGATGAASSAKAFAAAMTAAEAKAATGKKDEAKAEASSKGDAKADQLGQDPTQALGAQQPQGPAPKAAAGGPAAMLVDRPAPTPQQEQENIKELIRQAQVVLKKGGGEMKMQLKPEGIGQVQLKVSVQDGQVNVQMLTENDSAKRMLEKGLHELRSSLAEHQLKVDHMKVDVGQELQKHMDKQSDEQQREQARQFASDFMGQFREDREAFRQGFMENPGWRQYNGTRRMPVNPETVAEAQTRSSGSSSGSKARGSGRLDLVA